MSTSQQTLDAFDAKSHKERDCPACGETVTSVKLPEHIRDDCEGVDREVHYT